MANFTTEFPWVRRLLIDMSKLRGNTSVIKEKESTIRKLFTDHSVR